MSASGTLDCWQIEVVRTTSLYVVNSSVVVKQKQKKKRIQRPGRISCSESAASILIFVRFVRKVQWSWLSSYFLPGVTALRLILMNAIDRTKIISVSAGENSILFLYTLLLSEITQPDAVQHRLSQSEPLFSSQDNLLQIKIRQIHCSPYPIR